MAANFSNPYGAVWLADGGTPRTISVKARADISGGWWVNGSSAVGIVSSGADGYATSDIEGYPVSTVIGSQVIGLCLQNTASGNYAPVAMQGIFILPVASGTVVGSVYSGWPILAGSAGTVVAAGSMTIQALGVGPALAPVGRALSTMDNTGGFIVASINV